MNSTTDREERRSAAVSALHRQDVETTDELIDLAESVLDAVEDIDPELGENDAMDRCHEIADSCVPVYGIDILRAVSSSPALWWTEPEIGPAFDGSPTPVNIGAAVLYELAERIAVEAIQERDAARDEEVV